MYKKGGGSRHGWEKKWKVDEKGFQIHMPTPTRNTNITCHKHTNKENE